MGLFNHHDDSSSSSSSHTCPMPSNLAIPAEKDFIPGMTFQKFNSILSGSCAAFSTLVILILMFQHATHFSRPKEQGRIMKICWLVPLYSCFSFITIALPNTFASLVPWLDVFQAVALGSFFLLLCQFVSPSDQDREVFMAALNIKQKKNSDGPPTSGLVWYRKKWVAIFQYPVIAILVAVFSDITEAAHVYCVSSSKLYFAHLWLTLIINLSLTLAVMAVLTFYAQLKSDLKHHKPIAKLLAFKLVISLTFIERIIFWILRSTDTLKPNATLTYADVNMGLQTMLTCIQMVPISLFFHYAYDCKPYLLSNSRPLPSIDVETSYHGKGFEYPANGLSYQGGFLGARAWFEVIDPTEILRAIIFAFRMSRT